MFTLLGIASVIIMLGSLYAIGVYAINNDMKILKAISEENHS